MMAMTTNNSTRVNPIRLKKLMAPSLEKRDKTVAKTERSPIAGQQGEASSPRKLLMCALYYAGNSKSIGCREIV